MVATLPTRYGHLEFYSVCAQITPVLFLALVFELRAFDHHRMPALARVCISSTVGALFVLAEGVALHVLYEGYAHRQDQDWVIFPLIFGVVILLLPLALTPLLKLDRAAHVVQFWIGAAVLGFAFGVVWVGLSVLFFHY